MHSYNNGSMTIEIMDSEAEEPKPISTTAKIYNAFTSVVNYENSDLLVNAGWDSAGKVFNIALWLGSIIDVITDKDGVGKDEYFSDMAELGFAIGTPIALIAIMGALYAHFILNSNAMRVDQKKEYHIHEEENDSEIDPRIQYSWLQYTLLAFDMVAHVGDHSGTAVGIFNIATAQYDPSRVTKLIAIIIATLGGIYAARANIRTCYVNVHLHNKNQILDSETPTTTTLPMHLQFIGHEVGKLRSKFAGASHDLERILDIMEEVGNNHELASIPRSVYRQAISADYFRRLPDDTSTPSSSLTPKP